MEEQLGVGMDFLRIYMLGLVLHERFRGKGRKEGVTFCHTLLRKEEKSVKVQVILARSNKWNPVHSPRGR